MNLSIFFLFLGLFTEYISAGHPQWALEADFLQSVREGDNLAVVKLLRTYDINPSIQENMALKEASYYGYHDVVKTLLDTNKVDPIVAIPHAAEGDNEEVMMSLLEHLSDPTVHDNIAIRWTSRMGKTEMVEELLKNPNVDPSVNDNEPIKMAASLGHTAIVKALLKHPKVDPTAEEGYALRNAAASRHWDTVRALLESGKADHVASIESAITYAKFFIRDSDPLFTKLLQSHLEQARTKAKQLEEARAALIEKHEKEGTLSLLPECSICTDYILPIDVMAEIPCHPYHASCIAEWVLRKRREGKLTTCPMCRDPI